MKQPKNQKHKSETRDYKVLVTMPKFKESKGYDSELGFDDYEKAYEHYKNEVMNSAKHVTLVDTKRIIGLYSYSKVIGTYICMKQIVIEGYDNF